METYRTASGRTLTVTYATFRAFLECDGCGRAWKTRKNEAEDKANIHASKCHRIPGKRPAHSGAAGPVSAKAIVKAALARR